MLKPASARPGDTAPTVVADWLTLISVGAWAGRGQGDRIKVLFERAQGRAAAAQQDPDAAEGP